MSCCGPRSCHDFDDEREGPSDSDLARFGGDDISCPSCGASVYHDVPICHACGHAIRDAELTKKTPAWVPLLAVGAVLGTVLCYVLWLL